MAIAAATGGDMVVKIPSLIICVPHYEATEAG